jgi:hypothetical protein
LFILTIDANYGWNKQILINWYYNEMKAGRDPRKKNKDAKDIGTLYHDYIGYHELGISIKDIDLSAYPMSAPIVAEAALKQWINIKRDNEIEVDGIEESFVSERYQYGGRIDLRAKVRKKKSLVDFKTSPSIYQDHLIQLGSYDNLLIENDYEPEEDWILHINKSIITPDAKIVEFIHIPKNIISEGFDIFLIYRKLYDLKESFHL